MKKTVTIILYLLAVVSIVYCVMMIFNVTPILSSTFFNPGTILDEIKSGSAFSFSTFTFTENTLLTFLATASDILLLVGSIAVLQKKLWGLYCVRVFFIISFIWQVIFTVYYFFMVQATVIPKGDGSYLVKVISTRFLITLVILELIVLIFFFLPSVRNLFEKEPPIPSEPIPN